MHGHPLKENDLVIESVDIQQRKKSLLDFEGYNFLIIYLLFHSFFSFLLLSLLGFPHFTNTVNFYYLLFLFSSVYNSFKAS